MFVGRLDDDAKKILNDKKDGRNHIEIRERAESNLNEYMDRKEEERTVRV